MKWEESFQSSSNKVKVTAFPLVFKSRRGIFFPCFCLKAREASGKRVFQRGRRGKKLDKRMSIIIVLKEYLEKTSEKGKKSV